MLLFSIHRHSLRCCLPASRWKCPARRRSPRLPPPHHRTAPLQPTPCNASSRSVSVPKRSPPARRTKAVSHGPSADAIVPRMGNPQPSPPERRANVSVRSSAPHASSPARSADLPLGRFTGVGSPHPMSTGTGTEQGLQGLAHGPQPTAGAIPGVHAWSEYRRLELRLHTWPTRPGVTVPAPLQSPGRLLLGPPMFGGPPNTGESCCRAPGA